MAHAIESSRSSVLTIEHLPLRLTRALSLIGAGDYDVRMGLFDGTPLERPVTCPRCEQRLDACSCPRDAQGEILLPSGQAARVSREKRSGGKMITIISGLDTSATDCSALLAQLKKSCATGGTLAGERIEIQGDHRDKVLALLKQKGYPARLSGG